MCKELRRPETYPYIYFALAMVNNKKNCIFNFSSKKLLTRNELVGQT